MFHTAPHAHVKAGLFAEYIKRASSFLRRNKDIMRVLFVLCHAMRGPFCMCKRVQACDVRPWAQAWEVRRH